MRAEPTRGVPGATRRRAALLAFAIGLLSVHGVAGAAPGEAFVALQPAPVAGAFDPATHLLDPAGFPARAGGHPDGWALLYRAQSPPPGWVRPFEIRAGGRACHAGSLHPRYALALAEMLPVRAGAILSLRSAPDSIACAPGKPGPQPFLRDGWLFLHDGALDIADVTDGLWNGDLGSDWEAFKSAHPRDYHGNGHATRGNASEIYFLVLLHEITRTPEDVPGAFRRTLLRLLELSGGETLALNAVLQSEQATWVLRWTGASEDYPILYTHTRDGEYCISDSLAPGGDWQEIPDRSLAVFSTAGGVEILPVEPAATLEERGLLARGPRLRVLGCPATGELRLLCRPGEGPAATLNLFDAQGRSIERLRLEGGSREVELLWRPPRQLRSGPIWARLGDGRGGATARLFLLR